MLAGKTTSGFEFEINENIKNDYRFIRAYRKAHSNDEHEQLIGLDDLLTVTLGESGAERLMSFLAEKDGTVPSNKVMEELAEIIKIAGSDTALKNS